MLKPGVVVVDVAMNQDERSLMRRCSIDEAEQVASYNTGTRRCWAYDDCYVA